MGKNNTFIRITNRDIYDELKKTHDDVLSLASKQKSMVVIVKGLFMFNLALLSGLIYVALK